MSLVQIVAPKQAKLAIASAEFRVLEAALEKQKESLKAVELKLEKLEKNLKTVEDKKARLEAEVLYCQQVKDPYYPCRDTLCSGNTSFAWCGHFSIVVFVLYEN